MTSVIMMSERGHLARTLSTASQQKDCLLYLEILAPTELAYVCDQCNRKKTRHKHKQKEG